MTDLHTHLLPGMDDGPKDLDPARKLLEQQLLQGVDRIALTSHYHCEMEPPESFLSRREQAVRARKRVCPEGVTLKRGCEVFFSPELLSVETELLCLEGTRVLLLELPVLQKPLFLPEVLNELRRRDIVPLIAHAERYGYVERDPGLLVEWKALGARIQVNAQSVLEGRFARKLLKWGLADVIASDAHCARYRPPNLKRAMEAAVKHLGPERALELQRDADLLFSGGELPDRPVHRPRMLLGMWV